MNKLERYITDCKSQFEEEPPAGHFERMQQKFNRQSKRITALRWSIAVAASVVILFLTGIILQNANKQYDDMLLCENAIDMKGCYLDRMNEIAGQIEALSVNLDQWDRQQVMTDVQNIIDITDSDFESEIPEELPDSEAKSILSNYYRQNLESLETIVRELRVEN